MRDRHLDYFLGYAEAAPVPFRDSGSSAEHLTPELGNLRAALEHAATHSPRQHV
jgi:hypothetical protein